MSWKEANFGDAVCYLEGPGVRKWQFKSSGIKLIKIRNLVEDELFLDNTDKHLAEEEVKDKYPHFLLNEGDLVIASSGVTWGKIGEVKSEHLPLCLNTRIIKLVPKNDIIHKRYLWHFIKSSKFRNQIEKIITGSAQPNFGPSHLAKIKIPLPTLEEQKKIAAILDAADALRQKDKALITKYEELTQSLFLDMFGDPVSNPKGWEKLKFGEVGKLDRGKSKHRPRNAPELLGGPYPLIQTGDVANCEGYIYNYKSTYSDLGLAQSKMWPSGTLCITIAANIAKTGILTFDACFPDSVVGFVPNKFTNREYVQYWVSILQKILEESAPKSAQRNINLVILRKLEIPIPPIELQNKFAQGIQQIEKQKQLAQQGNQKTEHLFNSLLQRAFKGELTKTMEPV